MKPDGLEFHTSSPQYSCDVECKIPGELDVNVRLDGKTSHLNVISHLYRRHCCSPNLIDNRSLLLGSRGDKLRRERKHSDENAQCNKDRSSGCKAKSDTVK